MAPTDWTNPDPVTPTMRDRPIPDMADNINELVNRLRAKLVAWDALGEITIKIDVLGVPGLFVLHIPLPKG
jgi:hypothetical protein